MKNKFKKELNVFTQRVVITLSRTAILMLLWNVIVTDLFGLSEIGFWRAMGLIIVCGLLFRTNKFKPFKWNKLK